MEENSYRKLAEHLDRLPDGFPPSSTGAELRLLRRLFTPEEAGLATHLTLDAEEAPVIATRAGLSLAEAEQRLREMARRGLIMSVQRGDGPTLYRAMPFVVGIYEFQVNALSEGLLHLCFSLCPESAAKIMSQGELEKALAEVFSSKIAREKKRQLASRLIFEARKATEQMDAKVIRKA